MSELEYLVQSGPFSDEHLTRYINYMDSSQGWLLHSVNRTKSFFGLVERVQIVFIKDAKEVGIDAQADNLNAVGDGDMVNVPNVSDWEKTTGVLAVNLKGEEDGKQQQQEQQEVKPAKRKASPRKNRKA